MEAPISRTVSPEVDDGKVAASSCLSPEAAIFSRYQKAVLRYTGSVVTDTPENRAKAIFFHDQGITFQEAGILYAMALVEESRAVATPALQEAVDGLPTERLALMYRIWREGRAPQDGYGKRADSKDKLIKVLGLVIVAIVVAWATSAWLPDSGGPAAKSPVPTIKQAKPTSGRAEGIESTYTTKLVEAQKLLKQMGLYEGKVDGIYGRGTKAALEAFQTQTGLEQTGRLDNATFDRLRDTSPTDPDRQAER